MENKNDCTCGATTYEGCSECLDNFVEGQKVKIKRLTSDFKKLGFGKTCTIKKLWTGSCTGKKYAVVESEIAILSQVELTNLILIKE